MCNQHRMQQRVKEYSNYILEALWISPSGQKIEIFFRDLIRLDRKNNCASIAIRGFKDVCLSTRPWSTKPHNTP